MGWSKQQLPASVVRAMRFCRQCAYVALAPSDYFSRLINDKQDFPPLHLRRYVGPLRSFEASGAEFMAYLRLLCRLQPWEKVLDIGCGCGLMALPLLDYLSAEGQYVGLDIHRPSIEWCRRNISSRRSNFTFAHINVRSDAYHPSGQHDAARYTFPFEGQTFDVILLKSVFTHMRPREVENYLRETSRLLTNDGRCLASLFLLNEKQEELSRENLNQLNFNFGEEEWRYVYKNSPESAIAYQESFILDLLQSQGLTLKEPIFYGSWTGANNGLSFQDLLLIEKNRSAGQTAQVK